MDIDISYMNIEDLEEIKDVLISDFDDFWSYNILKGELEALNSKYFVARYLGEIVGFAGIKIIDLEAEVINIVTRKDKRNLGIGSLLLEKLILASKDLGLNEIYLEVNSKNYVAISLYEKFKFEKIGIRKKYYNGNDAMIMRKKFIY